jgi:prephenate dehydrogenase
VPLTPQRIGIVGVGLIGASLAGALRRSGSYVVGFDSSTPAASTALEKGLVDETAGDLSGAVQNADVVILAVPVLAILGLLPVVDALARPDALILDTGSVKRPIVEAMQTLPGACRAVGGHPLAGSERSGSGAANSDLFRGRPFILTASVASSPAAKEGAREIVRRVGARPVTMDAERHDRVLARTSHLPQLLASSLAASLELGDVDAAGPGLRDMTRLAGSDVAIWNDILMLNRGHLVNEAHRFIARLQEMVTAVDQGEMGQVEEMMRNGASRAALVQEAVPV